jgi:endonuclease/exonuclease/phosphatase family metal-dependent hydrolase
VRRLRVVSFNILHGLRADGSGVVDLPSLCRSVAALEPDVLALQEVDVGVPRSGRKDQAAEVGRAAGLTVVFGKAARVGGIGKYGNALLARGAITDVEVVALPKAERSHEPRGAILATAEGLCVCVTHLSIHRPEVHDQLRAVVDRLVAAGSGPRLLVGDLNLGPEEVAPVVEQAGLVLADPSAATFPRTSPRARIDHVAVSRELRIADVEVVATESSDHCALVVEVEVP